MYITDWSISIRIADVKGVDTMTEKRFTETISTGIVTDNKTKIEYSCEMRIDDDFLNLVNTIAEENEQLKQLIKKVLETTPIEHSLAIDLKNSIRELYE